MAGGLGVALTAPTNRIRSHLGRVPALLSPVASRDQEPNHGRKVPTPFLIEGGNKVPDMVQRDRPLDPTAIQVLRSLAPLERVDRFIEGLKQGT